MVSLKKMISWKHTNGRYKQASDQLEIHKRSIINTQVVSYTKTSGHLCIHKWSVRYTQVVN